MAAAKRPRVQPVPPKIQPAPPEPPSVSRDPGDKWAAAIAKLSVAVSGIGERLGVGATTLVLAFVLVRFMGSATTQDELVRGILFGEKPSLAIGTGVLVFLALVEMFVRRRTSTAKVGERKIDE